MYEQYHIKDGQSFNPDSCPIVKTEVMALSQALTEFPLENKLNIILSYLKSHSINSDWIKSNPILSRKMTSGSLALSHIEAYFDECKTNILFLKDFEHFITLQVQKADI